jgi:aminodeoxyfutalosine deaminase
MSADLAAYVRALPKVELHLHLLGSASPETVVGLAARYPDSPVPADLDQLRAFYQFRDFPHFIDVYKAVAALVRDGEDIRDLTVGLARDLADHTVRYAEVMVCPYLHHALGMPGEELLAGMAAGRREAADRYGVRIAWIFDLPGESGLAAGDYTLDLIRRSAPAGLVGFSLAGLEEGVDRAAYADLFAQARALGLHSVPHAGETTGPATIWAALDALKAERIGHGTSCLADPRLVDHLAEQQIPLEVCPTSNLRTRTVAELAAHPVAGMLAAGLVVTVNTDDPPMFGADLTSEYLNVARLAGLDRAGITALAANGIRSSFLDGAVKAVLLSELDAVTTSPGSVPGTGR